MSKRRTTAPKRCTVCGAGTGMYLCHNCSAELRDLLLGSPQPKGQPGLVWYLERIKEQAYRQAKLATAGTRVAGTVAGFDLLSDRRAIDLLRRIKASLDTWQVTVHTLSPRPRAQPSDTSKAGPSATRGDEIVVSGVRVPVTRLQSREARQIRYLADRIPVIRTRCADAHRLRAEMMDFAREAWEVINPVPDNFCGPCPAELGNGEHCNTLLYATEDAMSVRCDRCHATHDVNSLRSAMREVVADILFTGTEIRRLMETRLADKMPKSTFYKMISDGRLIPRGFNADQEPLFTYADICAARLKPAGAGRKKSKIS